MTYSRADKARAVEVYLAEGATAAAVTVGCSVASVYVWLAELETPLTKKGSEARIATAERLALKRQSMIELFHDKALELAAAVDPNDVNTARFATPAAIFCDKALLLSGLLRKASDPTRLSLAEVDSMISELESERDKLAPAESKRADVDRELERMRAELERKIRGEMLAEVDRELAQAVHPERAEIMQQVLAAAPVPNGKPPDDPPADRPSKSRYRREPPDVGPTWH